MPDTRPLLSVIIPVFNEERNIPALLDRLKKALAGLEGGYEVIAVDDGSTDGSLEALKGLTGALDLKVIELARNYGQSTALYAGIEDSSGRYILTIDADLQNHPEDIGKLLEKIEEGYDVVSGCRANRATSLYRRLSSRLVNLLLSRMLGRDFKDLGSGLKIFRREIFEDMADYGEMARYPFEFAVWKGASLTEIEIGDSERVEGRSRYNTFSLVNVLVDFLIVYSSKSFQLYVLAPLGALGIAAGVLTGVFLFVQGVINQAPLPTNKLLLALLLILGGMLSISLGLINERISRIYRKMERKKFYAVKRTWKGSEGREKGS